MSEARRIKVKRDGPRGWHWIAAAHFDPTVHEIVQDEPPAAPVAPAAPSPNPTPAPRRASPKSKAASAAKE